MKIKTKLSKTMRERLPRREKKRLLRIMSRPAFHAMMEWNYYYFGGVNPLELLSNE